MPPLALKLTIDKENNPSGRRIHKPSHKVHLNRQAQFEKEQLVQEKKRKQAARKALLSRQAEQALVVEQPGDSPEIKQLKVALQRTCTQRDALAASHRRQNQSTNTCKDGSIPRPRNTSTITVAEIRDMLGLAGDNKKLEWNGLRNTIRKMIHASMLDHSAGWKAQPPRKLARIYDAVEAAEPVLKQCHGQWATAFLAHQIVGGQKSYRSRLKNSNSYRSRKRHERNKARLERLHAVTDFAHLNSTTPSRDPSPATFTNLSPPQHSSPAPSDHLPSLPPSRASPQVQDSPQPLRRLRRSNRKGTRGLPPLPEESEE